MTVLIGSDLDRTLIYSRGAVDAFGDGDRALVAVERYQDADSSWVTVRAATALAAVPGAGGLLVPVTTRTAEQWRRITLPGPAPTYAIVANGGVLLVDDVADAAWAGTVAEAVEQVAPLDEVLARAKRCCLPEWTLSLRAASDLFCYAVLDRARVPGGFVEDVSAWAQRLGWQVSLQGRKLYWVPIPLTKSAALAEVARRTQPSSVLAAGDSLLDADLLLAADAAIVARHGELVETGWRAPSVQVTATCGVLAGEEIADWFVERLTS